MRFFGREPVSMPTVARLEVEKKWRSIQLEQRPKTCGADLEIYGTGTNKARIWPSDMK